MKKLLIILILLLTLLLPANAANIMPANTIKVRTLGLYQLPKSITIYKEPDENSPVLNSIKWSAVDIFPEGVKFNELFTVFVPEKEFGLALVTDETDDWVQIIYNRSDNSKGWIKKDDPYKFMNWMYFFNTYGRKYGLYILKNAPEDVLNMKSAAQQDSQFIAKINMPQKIKLNALRGNWMLISVFDWDRIPKTGYIHWRADDGTIYLFPDIK